MLTAGEARDLMLASIEVLGVESIDLAHARGRVLANPLVATRDQPPFACSAMDGYAFASDARAKDLVIVGESAAGRGYEHSLGPDQAVRISTGAPLPAGADAVLIQEEAQRAADRLIGAHAKPGAFVRPRGYDFSAGDALVSRGRTLTPVDVALAAATGLPSLHVMRTPRISVWASGDELISPGAECDADQIYDAASFAVCGAIDAWGAKSRRLGVLADDEDALKQALSATLGLDDLTVLIGGASVGPHDHLRAVLIELGYDIIVPNIALRPGKPTWFAASDRGRVLGLPGNPVSAIVCSALFLRPIIERMLGRDPLTCVTPRQAPLASTVPSNDWRETYLRARLDETGRLQTFSRQDSSQISPLAKANALVIREKNAPTAMTDTLVNWLPLTF